MSIGAAVRRSFGPYEWQIAEAWRRMFVDLDDFVETIQRWTPQPERILEVGCGEGSVTTRLVRAFPGASITAIDIAPTVGRLFRGPHARVEFRQVRVDEVAAERPGAFDLVILADVIHHVPLALRRGILDSARDALATSGRMVFKDWVRHRTPIHLACFVADRYLTGDDVYYHSEPELRQLARASFGEAAILEEAYVSPWRNNFAMLLQR